jgi:two-component system phosphate regulon sensor histidine kinase PhoR
MLRNLFRRHRDARPVPEPGEAAEAAGEEHSAQPVASSAEPSYDELRAAFTAVVSHELRTPLARLLALLETAELPGTDQDELLAEARAEVELMRELVDEILFLSELETGREIVALAPTPALPVVREVFIALADTAARSAVELTARGDDTLEVPLRPRMLSAVIENDTAVVLSAQDDGVGVPEDELPRLFERFYRADRARASRGTGLGLAIVKHIVTSAGGQVEARGGPGRGLEVRCRFPS